MAGRGNILTQRCRGGAGVQHPAIGLFEEIEQLSKEFASGLKELKGML